MDPYDENGKPFQPSGLGDETECPTPHDDMVRLSIDGGGVVESPCYTCGAAV